MHILALFVTLGCLNFEAFAGVFEEFVNLRNYENYVCNSNDMVFSLPAISQIHCVSMCSSNPLCKNVFYKSGTSMCTGCDTFYTSSSSLEGELGTEYYAPIDADPACNKPARNFRLCEGNGPGLGHPSQGRIEILYNRTWWVVCNTCWFSDCPHSLSQSPVHNLNTICGTFGMTFFQWSIKIHTEYYDSMHFCVARLGRVPCVQRPYRTRPEVASDAASVHTERDLIWSHNAYCGVCRSIRTISLPIPRPPLITNVECTKTEDTIWDCSHVGPLTDINCHPSDAVGVKCN